MESTPESAITDNSRVQQRPTWWPFAVGGIAVYAVVPILMYVATNRQVSGRAVGYANLAGLALAGFGFWRVFSDAVVERLMGRFGIYSANPTVNTIVRVVVVGVVTWVACAFTFRALISTLVWAYR